MNKMIVALVAAAALAGVAAPALAQPGYDGRGYDNRGYDNRREDLRHVGERLQNRIDRTYQNGRLSRGDERALTQWTRELRVMEDRYFGDRRLSRDEARDLEVRADRIEQFLQRAERGRGRDDRGGRWDNDHRR